MRLLSSIIKSGRIAQETVIDLQERLVSHTTAITKQVLKKNNEEDDEEDSESTIHAKAVQERVEMLQSTKEEISMLLAEAKAKANILLEETTLKAEKLIEEANAKALEVMEQAKRQALHIQEEALLEKENYLKEAEPEIVEVIQKLVGHIVHEKIGEHTQWVLLLVKKMIEKEKIVEPTTLYLSEKLYSKITRKYEEAFAQLKVNLKQDTSLTDKACVLETSQGSISYDIDEGLKSVLEEIKILQNLEAEV